MNKTRKTSVRVKDEIMEIADELKTDRGYSYSDLFEMGVLLMDNGNQLEKITTERMYDEMIQRFEKLDKKISQAQEELRQEIQVLKNKKSGKIIYTEDDVKKAVDSIINIIEKREFWSKHGKILEPLGKEFFKTKSTQYKVPSEVLVEELNKKGYTSEKLLELEINPAGWWIGTKKSDKETMV